METSLSRSIPFWYVSSFISRRQLIPAIRTMSTEHGISLLAYLGGCQSSSITDPSHLPNDREKFHSDAWVNLW